MKLPFYLTQQGIGSLLILALVLLGVGLGVYLIGKQTNLLPEAAQNKYTIELYPSSEITIPLYPPIFYPDDNYATPSAVDEEVVFYEDEDSEKSVQEYVDLVKDKQELRNSAGSKMDKDSIGSKEPMDFSASAVYVLIKDKKGREISKKNFTFNWVSNNESILYVSPFSNCQSRQKKDNCTQTNGAYFKPVSVGKTSITVNLYEGKNTKKIAATGTFSVNVIEPILDDTCTSPPPCDGTIVAGAPQPGQSNVCPVYYCKPPFPTTKPGHSPQVSPTPSSSHNPPTFCTMDAKICSDGTYVGRIPPNCEFQACPK